MAISPPPLHNWVELQVKEKKRLVQRLEKVIKFLDVLFHNLFFFIFGTIP
jgi:hypothetical protein